MGALEDDDEDVYHRDSMSRYDTILGEEEPGDGLYGWTAPQQYTKKKGNASWENLESSRHFLNQSLSFFTQRSSLSGSREIIFNTFSTREACFLVF